MKQRISSISASLHLCNFHTPRVFQTLNLHVAGSSTLEAVTQRLYSNNVLFHLCMPGGIWPATCEGSPQSF
jgi:hypothetical protein